MIEDARTCDLEALSSCDFERLDGLIILISVSSYLEACYLFLHLGAAGMVIIRNKNELVNNADSRLDRKARELALLGLEAALEAVDPKQLIKSRVILRGSVLRIDGASFDLDKFQNIFVIGGGKASGSMAEALEKILGDRITEGALNIPYNNGTYRVRRIHLQEASHPVPDEAGVKGAEHILNLARRANEDDLVICIISGGGSSLMALPRGEISLQDKKTVTRGLLNSGATIN